MKKKTKSTETKMALAMKNAVITHNRHQRLWAFIALVGLFACGFMIGMNVNQHAAPMPSKVEHVVNDINVKPCRAVEDVLIDHLYNQYNDCDLLKRDVVTYQRLIEKGCPENHDVFVDMMTNTSAVMDALSCEGVQTDQRTCIQIEENLQERMPRAHVGDGAEVRIERAKFYAIMSERGCPENSQKYVELARQELEIARALEDDRMSEQETIEVVETYKRIQMQNAAREILDKARKITNPAIDFIIELEKIINE